jgi:hypothetical protein
MVVRKRVVFVDISSNPCFRYVQFAQMVETDSLSNIQQFLQAEHLLGAANVQSAEEDAQINRIRSSTFRCFHGNLAEAEHEQRDIG